MSEFTDKIDELVVHLETAAAGLAYAEKRIQELEETCTASAHSIISLYRAAVPHGNYGGGEFGNRFADKDAGLIAIRSALNPPKITGGE